MQLRPFISTSIANLIFHVAVKFMADSVWEVTFLILVNAENNMFSKQLSIR